MAFIQRSPLPATPARPPLHASSWWRRIRQQWRRFKHDQPGQRFRNHYCEAQRSGHAGARRAAYLTAGLLVVAAGIFLLPMPGPGMLVVALGAALLSQASLTAARLLDWLELRLRAAWAWLKAAPAWVQVLAGLLAAALLATAGWAAWTMWFG